MRSRVKFSCQSANDQAASTVLTHASVIRTRSYSNLSFSIQKSAVYVNKGATFKWPMALIVGSLPEWQVCSDPTMVVDRQSLLQEL